MDAIDLAAAASGPNGRMRHTAIKLGDLSAVRLLGAGIAAQLRQGDVVLLRGDLGAGKTELARAIIRARSGWDVEVPSPTFTLVQTYETPGLTIAHADLYRLEQDAELAELGLDEAMDNGAVLVEWPERAEHRWPDSRLEISLAIEGGGHGRMATLTANGAWAARLPLITEAQS